MAPKGFPCRATKHSNAALCFFNILKIRLDFVPRLG
jgi:hypothetical protein